MKKTYILFILFAQINILAAQITTPKEHFGFNIGDDYHLANFTQTEAYFKILAQQSDRIKLEVIGKTEENRDQPMLIVSSPENLSQLNFYKSIAQKISEGGIKRTRSQTTLEKRKSSGVD